MMKRILACFAAIAAVMLSGCAKDASESVPDENAVYASERLFDYFYSDDMPWEETKEFTLPEFSKVKFKWSSDNIVAVKNKKETGLFWGMPVWGVYLADLNGDGKREICSTVSMGSGMVDERVYAYDYANEKLYVLVARFRSNYRLELVDGVLMYTEYPENSIINSGGEEVTKPLTLDIMEEVDKSEI